MPGEQSNSTSMSRFSLYVTTFMVGVVVITLGPLLDPMTKDLGIPLAQAGLISVAFAVGMLVGVLALFWCGLIIGRLTVASLTGRFPASRMLMVGMAVMAVFAGGVALSNSVPLSMAMAFVSGLGASAAFPLILGFSGKFPAWHAGVVYSAVVLAGAVGRIVFPYLIGPIAHSAGFRIAMGLAFVLAAACSLLAFFLHGISGEGTAGEAVAVYAAARPAASGEGEAAG